MQRYTGKKFGSLPAEWHTAVLAFSFFDRYQSDGWDMRYFPALNMSVMLPLDKLVTDAPSEHFLNYRHRDSTLAVSIGRHSLDAVTGMHQYTVNAHSNNEPQYSVRKDGLAISTATTRDGTRLYTRSNFINDAWSTVMVSAKPRDLNTFQAVTSSISVGRSAPLDITKDGKLIKVIQTTLAFLDSTENDGQEPARPSTEPDSAGSSGSGFVVSSSGHILTNAHVICSIPDDHIDPRRWALFAARWVLGDSRKEKRHARTTA